MQNSPAMLREDDLRNAAATWRVGFENVRVDAPQIAQRPLVAVTGNRRLLHHVEAAHFVEPHDVIGMAVRVDEWRRRA